MKRTFGFAFACFALATLSCASAGPADPESLMPVAPAEGRYDLATQLRVLGLAPRGESLRRGRYKMLYAVDRRGRTLRVVADDELGAIIFIAPPQAAWRTHGPQIIQLPQAAPAQAPAGAQSLPSPAADTGPARDPLTPVYPTPRFNAPALKGH
jgi:hypothetical protein